MMQNSNIEEKGLRNDFKLYARPKYTRFQPEGGTMDQLILMSMVICPHS
jgi:hypothetical protein